MNITLAEFKNIDLRVGKIISAEKVVGSEKLLKLQVDIGGELRQLLAGIAKFYEPEGLTGREIPVVVNLEPRTMRGLESQGMMLAADVDGIPVLLHPAKEIPPGSTIR